MPTITYSPTSQLTQVEDFPADCERTVKGALHVRPGTTAVVSEGEAAHLKARGVAFSVAGAKRRAVPLAAPKQPSGPAPTPSPAITDLRDDDESDEK